MKTAGDWLAYSGTDYLPAPGRQGWAHLRHYSARFGIWGEGPPLVLVPGLAGGMALLGPLARVLSRRYRVISYQLRGEDDCFALRRRFGLEDLVDDLSEFLSWLGLEQPTVFGVSFGGVVALDLALREPWRLGALALQGVGPRFEPGLLQQAAGLVLSRYPLPQDSPFFNQFFKLFFGGKQPAGPLFDFVTRTCWGTDQGVMAHRFKLVEKADFRGRLDGLRIPALLMAGQRDLLVTPRALAAMAEEAPGARAVCLGQAGHLACVTHPDRVAAETRSFLESLED